MDYFGIEIDMEKNDIRSKEIRRNQYFKFENKRSW
jgi:hypothetical protein